MVVLPPPVAVLPSATTQGCQQAAVQGRSQLRVRGEGRAVATEPLREAAAPTGRSNLRLGEDIVLQGGPFTQLSTAPEKEARQLLTGETSERSAHTCNTDLAHKLLN